MHAVVSAPGLSCNSRLGAITVFPRIASMVQLELVVELLDGLAVGVEKDHVLHVITFPLDHQLFVPQ